MKKKREFHILIFAELFFLILIFTFVFFLKSPYLTFTGFTIYESASDGLTINDTYFREASPNNNYEESATLRIGNITTGGGTEYRAVIMDYNISSIDSGNTVTNAKLQIYVNQSFGDSNITIKVYRITSEWIESEATWNNRKTSVSWSSSGGDYSEEVDAINITNSSGVFYNFTVTDAVRGWVNGSYSNYGIILIAPDNAAGNYTYFASANDTNSDYKPKFIIDYTANAVPIIESISTDSSLSSPKQIGEQINISVNWTDLESDQGQLFVCNSSTINQSGCNRTTFCNTSFGESPSSCIYTVSLTDNRTTNFWIAVCDSGNCSTINQSQFYMNHNPNITVINPNGGETVNQSLGNYTIKFNVTDSDSDVLSADVYYGTSQNSTTNTILLGLNLTQSCTDSDSDTSTTNNCSYSWNSSGIYGTFFLTIIVNDSFITSNDSSDSSFNVRSLTDIIPPNITAQWISDSNIYSGKQIQIYGNVSDPNINTVWFSVNTTPQTNTTMANGSAVTYNASFTAPEVGTYKFKVWANDTIGNLNNSMDWQEFNVSKPNATSQNETAPSSALPYHTIKITAQLNATDSLRDVYANLNVPEDFTFLSNYSQNTFLGNFTNNQTKTATWFVSVPITEATYSVNVTYTDDYSNEWNSSNMQIQVTSAIGGYEISVAGYPEVETSGAYFAQAYFKQNGVYTNPDTITIQVYDATGSSTWGPTAMTQESTGIYNYSNTVGASVTEGQWETIINATKSSISYYTHQFWKVVGGPFDVRTITIVDSAIGSLNISVVTENTGGANKDLTLTWNLSRTDTGALLDSGSDTLMVPANTERLWSVTPTTTYVGQVKITFLGYYSNTEKAGAYKTFTTTSGGGGGGDEGGGGGGGGGGGVGGGAITTPSKETADFEINVEDIIYLPKNIEKIAYIEIENTGETTINNIILNLDLDKSFYTAVIDEIDALKPKEKKRFKINFLINDFLGEYEFIITVKSNELTKQKTIKIIVTPLEDYLKKESERLKKRAEKIKEKTDDKSLLIELKECEKIILELESNIKNEEVINAKDNIKKADECINSIEDKLEGEVKLPEIKMEYIVWVITWTLIIILIVALGIIIYILYRKFNALEFLKKQTMQESKKVSKKQLIDDKIKQLEDELK